MSQQTNIISLWKPPDMEYAPYWNIGTFLTGDFPCAEVLAGVCIVPKTLTCLSCKGKGIIYINLATVFKFNKQYICPFPCPGCGFQFLVVLDFAIA